MGWLLHLVMGPHWYGGPHGQKRVIFNLRGDSGGPDQRNVRESRMRCLCLHLYSVISQTLVKVTSWEMSILTVRRRKNHAPPCWLMFICCSVTCTAQVCLSYEITTAFHDCCNRVFSVTHPTSSIRALLYR